MLKNCFKQFHYNINLPATQVLSKIKSKTLFANRLSNSDEFFKGDFRKNTFKISFLVPHITGFNHGENPVFYGEVTTVDSHTKLTVKMRPSYVGYFGFFVLAVFFLFVFTLLIISLINGTLLINAEVISVFTILSFGGFSLLWGMSNAKYKSMKATLEELFKNEIISS